MMLKKLFPVICLVMVIVSCKKGTNKIDNLFKFKDYISFTTNGIVLTVKPIEINLAKDVQSWELNQIITDDIIDISPHVEGKLLVKNKHALVFVPDEPLEPDTEYTVKVKLVNIYTSIPPEFKKYTFQFKTIKPNFNIETTSLQSYDKNHQYLLGVLKSADVITIEKAKRLVNATQKGKKLTIQWNDSEVKSNYFDFKIDSINRFIEDSHIEVKWDGKAINADNSGKNKVLIPGINNFKILTLEITQSPEQYLSINFSDPIKKQQNFDGLVTIQGSKHPKFIVDGNILKVYPDTKLTGTISVDVFQGIKNTDNFKLKHTFSEMVSFEELKPQIRLINNGIILPNSQDLKFNFEAVNLKAVDVRVIKIFEDNILQFLQDNNLNNSKGNAIRQVGRRIAKKRITLVEDESNNLGKWKAYSIDLASLISTDPGSIYRVELSVKKEYSLYNCDTDKNSTNSEDSEDYYEDEYYEEDYYDDYGYDYSESLTEDEDLREEEYWDNLIYNYKDNYYSWRDRKNPCKEGYYYKQTLSQNLLASNLGVIAKKGINNNYYFAVSNILDANPESGADITLYNYQQQEIASTITDNEGLASIKMSKHASFAIITKNNNTSYVKLNDGNSLSLSKFDVSGKKVQRGLKGYLYGERGVWRPGDTLHLTFMLNDKDNKLPKEHPVKLEITNPNGKLAYKIVSNYGVNNFYTFKVPTTKQDKTGNWSAKVSVGGATFHKTLKIETVKPNRLKIKVDFEDDVLSKTKPLQGKIEVNWLHGAPAKNVKTEIKVKFSEAHTSFKYYKDYLFKDPTRHFNTEEITLFDDTVDEQGKAALNSNLKIGENAPGMLKAQFLVRAFENGGEFSMNAFSKNYAPYTSFVGLKSPKGRAYGSLYTDENQQFDIVVVDKNGNPIQRSGLEVKVYKIEWRWWWNSSYDNLSTYKSSNYHNPYFKTTLNTNTKGKATLNLKIPDNDGGRFLIRIHDPESGHATGRVAYFYKNWWRNAPKTDKEAAKLLAFSSDKENYEVGETAIVTFPSGEEGKALISIENGTEVLQSRWVDTKKGETKVEIPITEEMAPNVFVNISLLQPHALTANDLPLRLFGVIPLLIEDPNTKLEPLLKIPSVLRPEQDFTVSVSEKNNKPMTYTLAMVEEGLLDLTNFKTPNAWHEFYKRESLGVKTWDIYDDVIGAYSGSIDQVFAIGGDGSAIKGKNKKANRFKPVVTFLGPFSLKSGDSEEHTISMPNYVGSVRVMVVAGDANEEAYGSTHTAVEVKKPLMVLATLPRKLSPGEKVTLPVTVFAMEPKVKQVEVKLKLSSGIKAVGEQTKKLKFTKPDEKMAYFELDVSKAKGYNTVEVIATGNGEKSVYKVELDVVNPNPIATRVLNKTLEANTVEEIPFNTFGVSGTNSATLEFSTLPPMDFSRRLQYLVKYPHGCLEQTTSSVFPQLYLLDIFDLTFNKKQEIQANIEAGIKRLGHYQRPHGGMSYWLGENSANDWGTSYAGHFMIEAEKKGYVLPVSFKSNWLAYQKQAARDWRPSYKTYNSDLAQAYRLYTLALAGKPDLAAMNRLREFTEISNEAKWRLASAYALAGQNEASAQISKTANINFKTPRYNYYTYGSVNRNRAMALETMVITKHPKTLELAKYIAKELSSNSWMSTQTTAYSLLAIAKMVQTNGGKSIKLNYTINGKTETVDTRSAIAQRDIAINEGSNTITIKNNQSNVVYVRVLNSGKLPLGEEMAEQRGLSTSLIFKDLKGNNIDVSQLQQGQDFVATIKVTNLKNEQVNDVALTQIFPSGWEIVNTRFTDFGNNTTSQARFTDVRDDLVNFYFNLPEKGKHDTKTFNIMLNASYLGAYYLPGIQAEAMYDNDYFVRTEGKWIKIVK